MNINNPLKIATWNVNSLRVRLSQVLDWMAEHQPDVLALQEIKLLELGDLAEAIQQTGYTIEYSGQKTYNGVAVLSKQPVTDVLHDMPQFQDPARRFQAVTFNDIRIVNIYVPNGESVVSEKYQYKLNWLAQLTAFLKMELMTYPQLIVLGDLNIAPEAQDVHDAAAWEGQVLFSQPERDAFQRILDLGLRDCYRLFAQPEKSFTWWDYRLNAFKRNLGLRIDHILATPSLQCVECVIDKLPRSAERPSDHAPVVAKFA